MKVLIIYFLIMGFFFNCSEESNIEPEFQMFSDLVDGELAFSEINIVSFTNLNGSIYLSGVYRPDTLGYRMAKNVNAVSRETANAFLADINFGYFIIDDTLVCTITYFDVQKNIQFLGALFVDVPKAMSCYINKAGSVVYSEYLESDIIVNEANGPIEIKNHKGSIFANTTSGNIAIEAIIPVDGFCKALTEDGNIELLIPLNTSATIYAETADGIVSFNGLSIENLTQSTNKVTGILGSAESEIHLTTLSGNIEIIGF